MGTITLGRHSYGNPKIFGAKSTITIGAFCSISDFATFDAGFQHNPKAISQFPFNQKLYTPGNSSDPVSFGNTVVENDVWIADQAFIRSGVHIGNGAIIGYGAIVTKDVPDYAVVVGNPGRVVKKRYSDLVIRRFLQIAWWNWPEQKILENAELLMSNNIDQFLNKHKI